MLSYKMDDYLTFINNNTFPESSDPIWTVELPNGNYLVHYLAEQNNSQLLDVVARNLKLILEKNTDGKYISHILASKEYYSLLLEFLKNNIEIIDFLDVRKNHILHYCVMNINVLEKLFDLFPSISVNITNKNGFSPLLNCILFKNFESFKFLLTKDPSLHLNDNRETIMTCIIKVFSGVFLECKPWLDVALKYGANFNVDNLQGEYPLQLAYSLIKSKKNMTDTIDYMITKGASVNYGGTRKSFLVFNWVQDKNWYFINKYYDKIDFAVTNLSMNNILHEYLNNYNDVNEIKLLLQCLPDINQVNIHGDSVFHLIHPDYLLQMKDILQNKYINIWTKSSQRVSVLSLWKKSKHFNDIITMWKRGIKKEKPKLYKKMKNINDDIDPESRKSLHFVNNKKVNNFIYSAFMDNLIIYIFTIIKRYHKQLYLPLKQTPLELIISNFDSHEATIIKYRLLAKESLTCHLNCFIEYHNPTTYYCPSLPESFPKNKFCFYILSLINPKMNHTNLIIIDGHNKIIERFDPEGFNTLDKELDKWIMRRFQKYKDYKYYGLCQYFNTKNTNLFQLLELALQDERPGDPVGFCSAWSMWYLEMRLKNPKLEPSSLYYKSIKKISSLNISIREYIRNYANSIGKQNFPFVKRTIGSNNVNKNYFEEEQNYIIKTHIDKWFKSKILHE